jgi:hypothetical protein
MIAILELIGSLVSQHLVENYILMPQGILKYKYPKHVTWFQ